MKISEVTERTPLLTQQLLDVWERSVRATHLFLSDKEIQNIKAYVPQALQGVGVNERMLEMLFVAPRERGKGVGKALLQYGMEQFGVSRLAVNEQNPQAKGFYEHMGFQVYRRTELDEQGNPYPLLYMERK